MTRAERDHLRRNSGFSIGELVVATAIFSTILTLGVIATNKNIRSIVGKSRQEQALSSIKQYTSSLVSLQRSISLNPAMNACVKDRGQRCETDWTPFELHRPSGGLLAGSEWNTVMYSTETLAPCKKGERNCVLSALAEFRVSGETMETRVTIRNEADPKQKPAQSEPTSFQLNRFAPADSCPEFQAVVGIDQDGEVVCEEMNLPAGGGGNCGPEQAVAGMTEDGKAICETVPQRVDTTTKPPGFFKDYGTGQFGWADCSSISELNGVFTEARAKFTCNWQSSTPCQVQRGVWISRTCTSCSGDPQVCSDYDCSYCQNTHVESITCKETTNANRKTEGSGSFSCKEIDPGGCSSIPLGQCDSISCPCFEVTSAQGTVGCFRN